MFSFIDVRHTLLIKVIKEDIRMIALVTVNTPEFFKSVLRLMIVSQMPWPRDPTPIPCLLEHITECDCIGPHHSHCFRDQPFRTIIRQLPMIVRVSTCQP